MKIITAPDVYEYDYLDFKVFLAGGITKCPNWQQMVIDELSKHSGTDRLVIFNPRRTFLDVTYTSASRKQIEWEFEQIGRADLYSMFFCDGPSDQPICMYELGKMTNEISNGYNDDINGLIITCMSGYRRLEDVLIQTELATNDTIVPEVFDTYEKAVKHHAIEILKKYHKYMEEITSGCSRYLKTYPEY